MVLEWARGVPGEWDTLLAGFPRRIGESWCTTGVPAIFFKEYELVQVVHQWCNDGAQVVCSGAQYRAECCVAGVHSGM